MRGRGQYVADIRLSALRDVAFVRSPLAHARIRGIAVQSAIVARFHGADLAGIRPIRARVGPAGLKISEQTGARHRQGASGRRTHRDVRRADACRSRDIAASVTLDLRSFPLYECSRRESGLALVHEHWGDNVFLENQFRS